MSQTEKKWGGHICWEPGPLYYLIQHSQYPAMEVLQPHYLNKEKETEKLRNAANHTASLWQSQ